MIKIDLKDNYRDQEINILLKLDNLKLTTKDLETKVKLLTFKKQPEKGRSKKDDDTLVLQIEDGKANTGNFCGVIYQKQGKQTIQYIIGSRFGEVFLKRMLSYANKIYLDDVIKASKSEHAFAPNILFFLFIQSLEKASILGLPKRYKKNRELTTTLKGQIDVNNFLKKCIPYSGRITSQFYEQVFDKDVIFVLQKAIKIVCNEYDSENLNGIKNLIKLLNEVDQKRKWSDSIIIRAKEIVKNNPAFSKFIQPIYYAELIIKSHSGYTNLLNGTAKLSGFLIDLPSLFETYLERLLRHKLNNWQVSSQQQIKIYDGKFFSGNMYPDFVLVNQDNNKVAVFDAKYKKMEMRNFDVDRTDIYQIHTYISYFGSDALVGGLLYPFGILNDTNFSHSKSLFNKYSEIQNSPKFVIDGIELNNPQNINDLHLAENAFIDRMNLVLT